MEKGEAAAEGHYIIQRPLFFLPRIPPAGSIPSLRLAAAQKMVKQ